MPDFQRPGSGAGCRRDVPSLDPSLSTRRSTMLPNPLHPAVVHMPIALTILLPFFAVGALWAIRRGARPLRAWGLAVALLGALVGSGWVALWSGQRQEDTVERVVTERVLEA